MDIRDRNGRALALDDHEGYISVEDSTDDASNDNYNIDEPLIHDEDVSSYGINKNNIALENNAGVNLQHDVIAGVRDENDPRPDIEAAGIPNDDLVGVPIAGVNDEQQQELENNGEQQQELENNDKQQQELENNENVTQQIDNNNFISDYEGDGNNQPYFDPQTENEPDASYTDEDEVNEVIAENTEDENTNKDDPKDGDDDDNDENKNQPDVARRSKRKNKGKLKTKGPYQFENNSLTHRANENARKMGQLHTIKHEVSALVEYARICARVQCTTGGGFYEDIMRHPLTATLFTQYSVKKRIKVFREAGITAVKEELNNLRPEKLWNLLTEMK